VCDLGLDLLEARRVGIEGTAGERRGELVGEVVVDERLIALLGTGSLGLLKSSS
jgi:hypothetical protein